MCRSFKRCRLIARHWPSSSFPRWKVYTHTHNSPIPLPSLSNLSLLLALSDGCILNMRLEPYKVPIIPIILNLFKINDVFYIYIHKKIKPPIAKQSVVFFFIFLSAMCQHLGLYMYTLVVQYMYITEHKKELSKKKKKNTITIDPIFISTIKETGKNCSTRITGTSIKIFSHSFFV